MGDITQSAGVTPQTAHGLTINRHSLTPVTKALEKGGRPAETAALTALITFIEAGIWEERGASPR